MKQSRFTRIGIFFLLCCVVFGWRLSIAQPSQSLRSLLQGSSSDYQAVLADLPDTELPTALGMVKALRFKALHQDSPLSLADVKQFETAILARINRSQEISLNKSDSFPHKVEAKEITLEGTRITVPAHYAASGELRILAVQPNKEAGSLLPEFIINYATANPPVHGKLLIDGKSYGSEVPAANALFFIPETSPGNILTIGTHSASISLVDAAETAAEFTWQFTVGLQPTLIEPIPETAKQVGSFSVDAGKILKGAKIGRSVRVIVYESNDGRRYLVYEVHATNDPSKVIARTRDPNWLRLTLDPKLRTEDSIAISPKTPGAFPGNELTFSYVYSGPGTVETESWLANGVVTQGPTLSAIVEEKVFVARCQLEVKNHLPDGGGSVVTLYKDKIIDPLGIFTSIHDQAKGLFTNSGKGSIPLTGLRWFESINLTPLYSGETFPYKGGEVKRSVWKVGSGGGVVIADPATFSTQLHFSEPGVCEIVHDVALDYTFGNEIYHSSFKPHASFLAGVFKTTPKVFFSYVPEGIIVNTSRKVTVSKIDLMIDGTTKTFSDTDAYWELAMNFVIFAALSPITRFLALLFGRNIRLLFVVFVFKDIGPPLLPFQPIVFISKPLIFFPQT